MADAQSLLLTDREVGELLHVSRSTVWSLMATGELRSIKIGRARRVTREAVESFVARRVREGADSGGSTPNIAATKLLAHEHGTATIQRHGDDT
jgi:excisionase family DNA binding protein